MEGTATALRETEGDAQLTELQRAALRQRVGREERRQGDGTWPMVAEAVEAVQEFDCGCDEPQDYLSRPLERAHRCPNPIPRT